jgi:hypothetical protein
VFLARLEPFDGRENYNTSYTTQHNLRPPTSHWNILSVFLNAAAPPRSIWYLPNRTSVMQTLQEKESHRGVVYRFARTSVKIAVHQHLIRSIVLYKLRFSWPSPGAWMSDVATRNPQDFAVGRRASTSDWMTTIACPSPIVCTMRKWASGQYRSGAEATCVSLTLLGAAPFAATDLLIVYCCLLYISCKENINISGYTQAGQSRDWRLAPSLDPSFCPHFAER